jgi:transposase
MKQTRNKYTEEFRQEAVRLALNSGRPIAHVARELSISDGLLHAWIGKYRDAESKGFSPEELRKEQEELKRLRRELQRVKQENEILKKAAAYFAKESL